MLSSLLEKLNVVQDGISFSFKGLAMGQPIPREKAEYAAGCELLSHHQNSWLDLTNAAEYNSNIANEIGLSIGRLYDGLQEKKQIWSSLTSELTSLDDVIRSTESIVNMIGKLRMDASEIEEDLIRLENLVESEEFVRKQANERMKLNLYREQKLENLDKYRASLSRRHMEKLKKKEEEESFVKQVKAEALEQRFRQDLANYKTFGVLPEPSPLRTNPNLSEIELEQNPDELADYLADS